MLKIYRLEVPACNVIIFFTEASTNSFKKHEFIQCETDFILRPFINILSLQYQPKTNIGNENPTMAIEQQGFRT